HAARDGHRRLGAGGDRGDRAPHGAPRAARDGDGEPLSRGRRGAQLRRQRPAPARGPVQAPVGPARRRRRGRRGGRRARHRAQGARQPAPPALRRRRDEGIVSRTRLLRRRDRALGNRSILGDPRSPRMQSVMNLKIKFREGFRPFAPSVLREHLSEWFALDVDSPYMLLVAPVSEPHRNPMSAEQQRLFGIEKLNVPRSTVPAVTHVDYSARIQTVHAETNPTYHALLSRFHQLTGCPVLVNTSFNVRGEPIVCTPRDAY